MTSNRQNGLKLLDRFYSKNLTNGSLVAPAEGMFLKVYDPATGQTLGEYPNSTSADLHDAVLSAERAQVNWARLPPLDRSKIMLAAVSKLEEYEDLIACCISVETGRPVRTETLPEVRNAIRILRYFSGIAFEVKGESIPYTKDVLALTIREPIGVVAAIVPWNVPAMLTILKIAPALAAGNSIIVKPAEQSAVCTTAICSLLQEALPEGLINVLNGQGEQIGSLLVDHPRIRKVAFTGSVATGRLIAQTAGRKLIPTTLELGGKSPLIVFPDADLRKAAALADVGMRFSRQGQSCTSTTRMYVHESIFEDFMAQFRERILSLKIGDPLDDSTDIGSLVSHAAKDRAEKYVLEAKQKGLLVEELGSLPNGLFEAGAFMRPTLVFDAPHSSKIIQEEIFGPVVAIQKWNLEEDLIAQVNGTSFGLSAALVTNNLSQALSISRRIEAGFIQVNSGLVIQPGISFGGYKDSGVGREASLSSMLEAYTQVKSIIIDHS